MQFFYGLLGVIIFRIKFDIEGSLVEWISSLSTFGAVAVALWLARDKTNNKSIMISNFDTKEYKENLTEYNPNIGEYEVVSRKYKITYRGSILLYNPSDYPKSLYDIKMKIEYQEANVNSKLSNDEGKEVEYITLKPKDLVVLKYNFEQEDIDHEDFPFDSIIPYAMFFFGKTEDQNIAQKEIELEYKRT